MLVARIIRIDFKFSFRLPLFCKFVLTEFYSRYILHDYSYCFTRFLIFFQQDPFQSKFLFCSFIFSRKSLFKVKGLLKIYKHLPLAIFLQYS